VETRRRVGLDLELRATRNANPPLKLVRMRRGSKVSNRRLILLIRLPTSKQCGSTAKEGSKWATLRTKLPAGSERTLTGSGTSRPTSLTRTCSCRSRTMLPKQNPSLASSPSTPERKLTNPQTVKLATQKLGCGRSVKSRTSSQSAPYGRMSRRRPSKRKLTTPPQLRRKKTRRTTKTTKKRLMVMTMLPPPTRVRKKRMEPRKSQPTPLLLL